jgi:hypothetical protein
MRSVESVVIDSATTLPKGDIPMRYGFFLCLLALAACSTMSPAESNRNEELYRVARTCENGSLVVTGIATDGTPTTRTTSSGASERPVFEKCYAEKSAPIWKDYCSKQPGAPNCAAK